MRHTTNTLNHVHQLFLHHTTYLQRVTLQNSSKSPLMVWRTIKSITVYVLKNINQIFFDYIFSSPQNSIVFCFKIFIFLFCLVWDFLLQAIQLEIQWMYMVILLYNVITSVNVVLIFNLFLYNMGNSSIVFIFSKTNNYVMRMEGGIKYHTTIYSLYSEGLWWAFGKGYFLFPSWSDFQSRAINFQVLCMVHTERFNFDFQSMYSISNLVHWIQLDKIFHWKTLCMQDYVPYLFSCFILLSKLFVKFYIDNFAIVVLVAPGWASKIHICYYSQLCSDFASRHR